MSQAECIGSVLFQQRDPSNGADILFIVAGEEIWAHSIVVTKRSEVLAALFGGEFVESHRRQAQIEDCSAEDFVAFLHVLYTRKFDLSIPLGAVVLAALGGTHRRIKRLSNISLNSIVPALQIREQSGITIDEDEEGGIWTMFHTPEKAQAFSSAIMQASPNANITEPSSQDVIDSKNVIDKILAVTKLLDKYNVEGFAPCVTEQFKGLLAWGKSFHMVVAACFGLLEGSEYRHALWNICTTYASRNDEQATVQFKAGHRALSFRKFNDSVKLRASLQILRWQMDWVNANEELLGDGASHVKHFISLGMQEVVNIWAQLPVVQFQPRKRARIEER